MPYLLGHGTGNDFVVLPDPDGELDLTPALVRAICDRRTGLGADGVLRIVRLAAAGPDAEPPSDVGATYFMDHRNADGSLAEMCGNGLRLFAAVLTRAGWAGPDPFVAATRAGLRRVEVLVDDGIAADVRVEMGAVRLGGAAVARLSDRAYAGTVADVGNPHLVCVVGTALPGLDLSVAPSVDATVFPTGANVEFVAIRDGRVADMDQHVAIRVHERGVGETWACGTGACAVAATVLEGADGCVSVQQPGGSVLVEVAEGRCTLRGPAVVVGSGSLDPGWLASVPGRPEVG